VLDIDAYGNPIGDPSTIPFRIQGPALRADLKSAIQTLQRRITARTKDACAHPKVPVDPTTVLRKRTVRRPCPDCRNGYDTQAIRYAKQRRLQVLEARLIDVQGLSFE